MRTTSRPIDKIQIFSLLVDVAPTDLLRLPNNVRLKAIIKAQPEIPLALLFQRPLTDVQLSKPKKQLQDERKADIDRGVQQRAAPADKSYPLPERIRNERLPSHLGSMKRDKVGAKYVYFNKALMEEGTLIPSLFSLGKVAFSRGLTHNAQIGTSDCIFKIRFGTQSDRSLVSGNDQVFLLVSSEMNPKTLIAAPLREVEGILMCLHNEAGVPVSSRSAGRLKRICRFRRLCSVLCNSFESKAAQSQGHNALFKADRQKWVDDCEYRVDCSMILLLANAGNWSNQFAIQTSRESKISPPTESQAFCTQQPHCSSYQLRRRLY